ncbi:MAG: hypothetical protein KDK76_01235 [Chlamydiia bacterium]|nr:hypothetical protein [Chlamydiia bacterium]
MTQAEGIKNISPVSVESTGKIEEHSRGVAAHGAVQTHLNEMNDTLLSLAKEGDHLKGAERLQAKNSMFTVFKIMRVVMHSLRQSSENGKEMNKILKKEWKGVTEQQSANHEQSRDNVHGTKNYQILGILGSQIHNVVRMGQLMPAAAWMAETIGGTYGDAAHVWLNNEDNTKWALKQLESMAPTLGQAGNGYAQAMSQAEQYNLGIKESGYQHEVQSHTSEYQNATQQQTSDKQAVDNAADTAKQLMRSQAEILMGRAG